MCENCWVAKVVQVEIRRFYTSLAYNRACKKVLLLLFGHNGFGLWSVAVTKCENDYSLGRCCRRDSSGRGHIKTGAGSVVWARSSFSGYEIEGYITLALVSMQSVGS